jgi:hypothetical protein
MSSTTVRQRLNAADINQRQYFQLTLLWSGSPTQRQQYWDVADGAVSSCGGSNERKIAPDCILAQGLEKPDTVSLARFPTVRAFIDSQHSERMHEFRSFHHGAYRLATVEGPAVRSELRGQDLGHSPYLVEISRFCAGGAAVYETYEREVQPVLARYKYRLEVEMQPEFTSGLPFRADIVKVGVFERADGLTRLQADPDYEQLVRMHRMATLSSVWILGRSEGLRVSASKEFS